MSGDVVRRLGKTAEQLGYCWNVETLTVVRVVDTKTVDYGVNTKDLKPLAQINNLKFQEFAHDVIIYFRSWVGVLKQVNHQIVLAFKDGSECVCNFSFLTTFILRLNMGTARSKNAFQDGTVEMGVTSRDLFPIHHFDDQEFFCGDLVVNHQEKDFDTRKYGVIQNAHHANRICKVKWFRMYYPEGKPVPQYIKENEEPMYDLKDHPDFTFRPDSIVIRVSSFKEPNRKEPNLKKPNLEKPNLEKPNLEKPNPEHAKVYEAEEEAKPGSCCIGQVLGNMPVGVKLLSSGNISDDDGRLWDEEEENLDDFDSQAGNSGNDGSWETESEHSVVDEH
ncbi:unnamed protein product [Sphagnum tenellum]